MICIMSQSFLFLLKVISYFSMIGHRQFKRMGLLCMVALYIRIFSSCDVMEFRKKYIKRNIIEVRSSSKNSLIALSFILVQVNYNNSRYNQTAKSKDHYSLSANCTPTLCKKYKPNVITLLLVLALKGHIMTTIQNNYTPQQPFFFFF